MVWTIHRHDEPMPVRKRLAIEFCMEAVLVSDSPGGSGADDWLSSTDQVLVTKNKALLAHEKLKEAAGPIEDLPSLPMFTDAHHNRFRILK